MGVEHEAIHLETSSVLFRETPSHLMQAPCLFSSWCGQAPKAESPTTLRPEQKWWLHSSSVSPKSPYSPQRHDALALPVSVLLSGFRVETFRESVIGPRVRNYP